VCGPFRPTKVCAAGRDAPNKKSLQKKVEADLIFVGPNEAGRLDWLKVRERDRVETGTPLFAVDPELQQADVDMAQASFECQGQLRSGHVVAEQLVGHPEGCRRRALSAGTMVCPWYLNMNGEYCRSNTTTSNEIVLCRAKSCKLRRECQSILIER
jgi:hypothetical protein